MSPVAQGTYVGQHPIPNTSLRILGSGVGEEGPARWKTGSDSYHAVFSRSGIHLRFHLHLLTISSVYLPIKDFVCSVERV